MDVAALVISVAALFLSIVQFLRDASRQKKEATLNAYNELQKEVNSILMKYPTPMPEVERNSDKWNELTGCLAKLEIFAVGINTGIYSLDILNHMGGSFFIHQYSQLENIINTKRTSNITKGKHYDEFEKAVSILKKYRSTNCALKRAYIRFLLK